MSQPPCPNCRNPLERVPLHSTTCPHCGINIKPGARGRVLIDRGSSGFSALFMFVLLVGGTVGGFVWYLRQDAPQQAPVPPPAAPVAVAPAPAAPVAPDAPNVPARPPEAEPTPSEAASTADSKPPTPAEVVKDPEKESRMAAAKLKMAKQLLDRDNTKKGRQYLEELVKQYPDTPAAVDARKLLEKMTPTQ